MLAVPVLGIGMITIDWYWDDNNTHKIHVNGILMLTWMGYIDGKWQTIYGIHGSYGIGSTVAVVWLWYLRLAMLVFGSSVWHYLSSLVGTGRLGNHVRAGFIGCWEKMPETHLGTHSNIPKFSGWIATKSCWTINWCLFNWLRRDQGRNI